MDVECRDRLGCLQHAIEHSAHYLPSQGPLRVFVHHNTLHALEALPFREAVERGGTIYGCNAYLPEDRYRQKLSRGRILQGDIDSVLIDDLGDEADRLVGFFGTRYRLRLGMLEHSLRWGPDAEIRWWIAETDALWRFRTEAPRHVRDQMIDHTRRWVMRDLLNAREPVEPWVRGVVVELFERFDESRIERWDEATWEAFTLHLLWCNCLHGVQVARSHSPAIQPKAARRHLPQHITEAVDRLVNEVLIRFCAVFLDQGVSHWTLPARDRGFLQSWIHLYRSSLPVDRWLRGLPAELDRIERLGLGPLEIIDESLQALGIVDSESADYLSRTILALRGWAGMIWQMETNAEWAVHPAPAGSLVEYVAVRLLLERLAITHVASDTLGHAGELRELCASLCETARAPGTTTDQRAFLVFQLAQSLGWKPTELYQRSRGEWAKLVEELDQFSSNERRRVYHLAFERRYRNQTLDAIVAHANRASQAVRETGAPAFQVICCIDEREESFRRHLEEVADDCETFGTAGFFGVAMYYRGVTDAHYVPLCPIVVKPQHFVREEVVYSFEQSHRRRTETRRVLGRASHRLHTGSHSAVAGALTAMLGTLASIPLVARVLFPRLTARIRKAFGRFVRPPPITRLLIERTRSTPGPENGHLGYTVEEMVEIGQRVLRDIGLTERLARLVFIVGHGSSSLNNPHESAHDCGACGGGRGGPNARALAAMLSDPRVRERLSQRGLDISSETVFLGAYHNTCDDAVEFYDLDRLPSSHHGEFESAKLHFDEARCRNAHERCRRFESAELSMTFDAALRHVEGRAEDLSQVRPEYGHATNAICFVGRRQRTKSLFLDRRTFLTSYDPTADDSDHGILSRILQAVIPVCAGINLEYYFGYVDPTGYGCGTKLPHNITGLLGVMDGAASDLRPGLPWQMIEIHEPVRILFVIETTPEAICAILDRHPSLRRLVDNEWIQLATLDASSTSVHVFRHGRFEAYQPETTTLPAAKSSLAWYRGWREHLGYASIIDGDAQRTNELGTMR